MEELRKQLSEQLPNVMNIAADAMGTTTEKLEEMITTTGLASDVFMPKFAKAIRESVRNNDALAEAMDKVEAHQANAKTAMVEFADAVFKSGGADLLKGFFNTLQTTIETTRVVITGLMDVMKIISDWINNLINDITGLNSEFSLLAMMLKGLAVFMLGKMVMAFRAIRAGATGAAASISVMTMAVNTLSGAFKALMRIAGIGLLIEGIGAIINFAFGDDEKEKAAEPVINNNLVINTTGDGNDIADAVSESLANSYASMPNAVRR